MSIRRHLPLALGAVLMLVAPSGASAAWRLDPGFADHGRFERLGSRWQEPAGALADAGGGTVVWSWLLLQRITRGGRADGGFGKDGRRPLELDYSDYGPEPQVTRWGRTRTLVYAQGVLPPTPRVPESVVRVLDRHGRERPESAALTAALRAGDRRGTRHWLLGAAGGRVVDVERASSGAFSVRALLPSGRSGARHAVTWPAGLASKIAPPAPPVLSGGRILVVTQGAVAPRGLVALTADARVDRAWGRRGVTRLSKDGVAGLLPWRGGVIAVGAHGATWVDRRGRIVGRRALRIDVAATDRAGRLVVARSADDSRHVSLLRLGADRRVDRAFGRLALRAKGGRSRPVAIAIQDDGRVAVVGERVAYETYSDIREDFTGLVGRGTAMWMVRR